MRQESGQWDRLKSSRWYFSLSILNLISAVANTYSYYTLLAVNPDSFWVSLDLYFAAACLLLACLTFYKGITAEE